MDTSATSPTRSIAQDVEAIGRIPAVPRILLAVAQMTGLRFAAVARVTDRRWVACAVHDQIDFGVRPGGELPVGTTICNEVRQHHEPVVVGHASADARFAEHPTPKQHAFESYISVPILRTDGEFFGTLCAIDPLPARLDDPRIVRTLELFAELIAAQLESGERLDRTRDALDTEQDIARLRERFVAVLGHDLRSPLQAISLGAAMLKKAPLEAKWQAQLDRMQRSCSRMSDLIRDLLDFSRGRLGGGIPLSPRREDALADELAHVVSEVQAAHADRLIESDIRIGHEVICDRARIAQVLANLLVNAMSHGAADRPVGVRARCDDAQLEIAVSNGGPAIPAELHARLFDPFQRLTQDEGGSGLGLGLYIASEIAKAHGGTLEVASSDEGGTCFTFRMPRVPGKQRS